MKTKKGGGLIGNYLVEIIIGILILVFIGGLLYMIISGDLRGISNFLKNLF